MRRLAEFIMSGRTQAIVVMVFAAVDNDLYGTDNTIGYDTTMNTIVECVDRIRDTAQSHERIFFVEVMGRDAGFLAQNSAIASGAEAAIIPEDSTDVDQLAQFMERGIRKSKKSCIVIVSESPKCGALYYADRVRKEFPEFDVRVSILGHLQRGGRPSARDRILASRTGCGAIEAIMQGQRNVMVGVRNNEVVYVPLSEAIRSDKPLPISSSMYLHRNCIISTNWQMKNVPTKSSPNCFAMNISNFLILISACKSNIKNSKIILFLFFYIFKSCLPLLSTHREN